jgi:hypothetical protein
MTSHVRDELAEALRDNNGQLGKVFALLELGETTNRELVDGQAAANQGAAANLRTTVKVVLDGIMPKGPSVAAQSRRSIGGILRDNPELSVDARAHLEMLRDQLEAIATDYAGIETEEESLKQRTKVLEQSLETLPGVYVYTLPSLRRTVQKTDPDRFWFKVGKSDRAAGVRVGEQMRATGLPEDPWIARVYRHPTSTPKEIEDQIHLLLNAAGHSQATGRHSGREWYATNLEFLDALAHSLGCDATQNDPPDAD